jgi:uncharacterized protein YuzE
MKFTYDKEVDAAYVYLEYPLKDGQVKKTVEIDENIALDYDKDGKLLGMEILEASKHLKKNSILSAEIA